MADPGMAEISGAPLRVKDVDGTVVELFPLFPMDWGRIETWARGDHIGIALREIRRVEAEAWAEIHELPQGNPDDDSAAGKAKRRARQRAIDAAINRLQDFTDRMIDRAYRHQGNISFGTGLGAAYMNTLGGALEILAISARGQAKRIPTLAPTMEKAIELMRRVLSISGVNPPDSAKAGSARRGNAGSAPAGARGKASAT